MGGRAAVAFDPVDDLVFADEIQLACCYIIVKVICVCVL
jgi:hypothetical protein